MRSLGGSLLVALVCALFAAAPAGAVTINVGSTADTTGSCSIPSSCTLREAIIEANASAGSDIIVLPAGTYTRTATGSGEDSAANGDLDITRDLTIQGAGIGSTIIDAADNERVFDIIATNSP